MTHNPDAAVFVYRHAVFVYRHCTTGTILALYMDDARAMNDRDDYEHVATLEPRAWIEHHFDDATKEREDCAKIADAEISKHPPGAPFNQYQSGIFTAAEHIADAIRARGDQ